MACTDQYKCGKTTDQSHDDTPCETEDIKDYCFNVDNKIITCGFTKDEMDSLFRKGNLDGKDAMGNKFFYYGLTDFRELRVLYNQRNEAIQINYEK